MDFLNTSRSESLQPLNLGLNIIGLNIQVHPAGVHHLLNFNHQFAAGILQHSVVVI